MADREKVIKELEETKEYIRTRSNGSGSKKCRLMDACNAAVILLKEREAVAPIFIENPYTHLPVSYCPRCREPIDKYIVGNPYKMTKFCHYCGQEVRWDE